MSVTGAGLTTWVGAGDETLSGAWMACNMRQYRYKVSIDTNHVELEHTEAKMTALQKPKNPGTSSEILALLSLMRPMTTWALNIHESDTPKMTTVHTDIPERTDGVLVDSI